MRSRTALVSVAVAVLALAGCGSTKKAPTTAPLPPGVKRYVPPPPPKSATYRVNLVSTPGPGPAPAGAPNASGLAVITIDAPTNELCWKFSLTNVAKPTEARIYQYSPGEMGEDGDHLFGPYKPSGCVVYPPIALSLYEEDPGKYYISIHTAKLPTGAVRGQL